jgi:hypothetical protein
MTKVALCISGQPRSAIETFPLIYENIIVPNNADVFIHINFDSNNTYIEKSHADNGNCNLNSDIDKRVIDLYKPKSVLVEKPKFFKNINLKIPPARLRRSYDMNGNKGWTEEQHIEYTIRQIYNSYYSIYKSNELKELYSLENNINYDYVIRIRFDITPRDKLICSNYNSNFIHYLDMNHQDELISDWLNFGSNSIMNVYASLFLHMEYLNKYTFYKKDERLLNLLEPSDECGGLYEHMLRDLMHLHKIPKQAIKLNCGLA